MPHEEGEKMFFYYVFFFNKYLITVELMFKGPTLDSGIEIDCVPSVRAECST
jgi:hypothetical protein